MAVRDERRTRAAARGRAGEQVPAVRERRTQTATLGRGTSGAWVQDAGGVISGCAGVVVQGRGNEKETAYAVSLR